MNRFASMSSVHYQELWTKIRPFGNNNPNVLPTFPFAFMASSLWHFSTYLYRQSCSSLLHFINWLFTFHRIVPSWFLSNEQKRPLHFYCPNQINFSPLSFYKLLLQTFITNNNDSKLISKTCWQKTEYRFSFSSN